MHVAETFEPLALALHIGACHLPTDETVEVILESTHVKWPARRARRQIPRPFIALRDVFRCGTEHPGSDLLTAVPVRVNRLRKLLEENVNALTGRRHPVRRAFAYMTIALAELQ